MTWATIFSAKESACGSGGFLSGINQLSIGYRIPPSLSPSVLSGLFESRKRLLLDLLRILLRLISESIDYRIPTALLSFPLLPYLILIVDDSLVGDDNQLDSIDSGDHWFSVQILPGDFEHQRFDVTVSEPAYVIESTFLIQLP